MKKFQNIVIWSVVAAITASMLIVLICSIAGKKEPLPDQSEGTATSETIHFDIPAVLPVENDIPETTPATGELHIDVGVTELPHEPVVEDVIIVPVEGT